MEKCSLIVGCKHYPRTLENIENRISDLDYLRRALSISKKPQAQILKGAITRALKRYNDINEGIYIKLRLYRAGLVK